MHSHLNWRYITAVFAEDTPSVHTVAQFIPRQYSVTIIGHDMSHYSIFYPTPEERDEALSKLLTEGGQ